MLSNRGRGLSVLVLAPEVDPVGGIGRASLNLVQACAGLAELDTVQLLTVWKSASVAALGIHQEHASSATPAQRKVPYRVQVAFVLLALTRAFRQRPDVVVATHPHLSAVAGMIRIFVGSPFVVWAHGLEAWRPQSRVVRYSMSKAVRIWCASEFTVSRVRNWYGSDSSSALTVLPHAVSDTFLRPSTKAPSKRADLVLTVARLELGHAYKGVDTLIDVWPDVLSRVPGAALVVVGDGSLRSSLVERARQLGLRDSIHFRGKVTENDLIRLYGSCRLFALPGRLENSNSRGEGFGLVLIEAAASGTPVVAGHAAGSSDAVVDGVTGLLVDGRELDDVRDAIVAILTNDVLADRLGDAGREFVRRRHSIETLRRVLIAEFHSAARG